MDDDRDELFEKLDERCIVRCIGGDEERGLGCPEREKPSSQTSGGFARVGWWTDADGAEKFWMED
jgi:hypothetical protein